MPRATRRHKILAVFLSLFVFVAIDQVLLRVFPPEDPYIQGLLERTPDIAQFLQGGNLGELREQAAASRQLLVGDSDLGHALPPGLETTQRGATPDETVEVRVNREGLRMREVERRKPAGVFRIACVGDSLTFGWRVPEPSCYPRRLETLLRDAAPGRAIEVLNFGVPSYSSYQARLRVEGDVGSFDPDLVVVAVGVNDLSFGVLPSDRVRIELIRQLRGERTWTEWLCMSSFFAHTLQRLLHPGSSLDPDGFRRRVSNAEYLENIRAIANQCELRGWSLILVDDCIRSGEIGVALGPFATENQIPHLSFRSILEEASDPRMPPATTALGTWPAEKVGDTVSVHIRVGIPHGVPESMTLTLVDADVEHIAGPQSLPFVHKMKLGEAVNGQTVVQAEVNVRTGSTLQFTPVDTAMLQPGSFNPNLLSSRFFFRVNVGSPTEGEPFLSSPVYRFGHYPFERLMLEAIHPTAAGHDLIARRLAATVEELPRFQTRVKDMKRR